MKKLLYIITFVMSLSLTSCDKLATLFSQDADNSTEYPSTDSEKENVDSTITESNNGATVSVKKEVTNVQKGIEGLRHAVDSVEGCIQGLKKKDNDHASKIEELKASQLTIKNLFVILAIYTIIIIVLVILLTKKVSLNDKKVKDIIRDFMSKQKPSQVVQTLGQSQKSQHEIKYLSSRLDVLSRQIDEIRRECPPFRNSGMNNQAPNTGRVTEEVKPEGQNENVKTSTPVSREFYMERPSNDMEFDMSRKKASQTEDTLYKFVVDKKKDNVAEFIFAPVDIKAAKRALNSRDKTIDPVCDIVQKGLNGDYVSKPGIALIKDGKCIVTKKAMVTFN